MLKISLVEEPRHRRIVVEGMLVVPWTDELWNECEKARTDLGGRELVVDLRGLTAVGPEGEDLLLRLMTDKIKLQCGVYMRELLRLLARDAQRTRGESGNAQNDADPESEPSVD